MTLRDRLAEYLKDPENAGYWIDGRELATSAGAYAWRSRVSDCRIELGMQIENRRRVLEGAHGRYTVSEYRYVPPPDRERERYEDDGLTYADPRDERERLMYGD